MAAADIGAKIKLEGESSFNRAMRDAAKNTKSLSSELKLADAQFKATGNAQEYMAQKDKILKEQLEQQTKAVETAKEALNQLEKAGDTNSTKMYEWRSKLAQAEQQVLQLSNAVANNAQGLDEAGNAYDNLGESMQNAAMDAETAKVGFDGVGSNIAGLTETIGKIGEKFSWEGLNDTLSGINAKIDAVIQRAVQMAQALWDAGVDATVWADDLITESVTTGIDTQTLQQWKYASRFVDTSVDTIISARTKLLANMSSTSKDMALNFNSLHVATRNVDGTIRGLDDVFWDVIGALGEINDETTRDALAMKVLGKNAKELNPLIEAGREEWEKYANRAPLISEDQISALGSANDSIEDMNAQLEALKLDALAYLAPTIQTVADAISAAAGSLKAFMDSEEGQQALSRLESSISGLITDFTELDFGQILTDASGAITGIINGFSEILEDKNTIITGLEAIGVGVAAMKLAEAATSAMTLFTNLKLLKTVGTVGSAAAGAGAAAAGGGATTAGATAAGGVAGAIAAKAATVAAGVASKVPVLSAAVMGATAFMDHTETGRTLRDTGDIGQALATAGKEAGEYVETVKENIATFGEDWLNLWGAFQRDVLGISDNVTEAVAQTGSNAAATEEQIQRMHSDLELLQGIVDGDLPAYAFDDLSPDLVDRFPGSIFSMMMEHWGSAENWYDINSFDEEIDSTAVRMAQELIDALSDGVDDGSTDVSDATSGALTNSVNAAAEAIGDRPEIMGKDIDVGLANGINENASIATAAAESLANAVASIMASALDINSPSKVMRELGAFTGEGFALGLEDSASRIATATDTMLYGIDLRAPEIQSSSQSTRYDAGYVPGLILSALSHMTVQIDGRDAGVIMLPTIEELMTDQMMSRRYDA